MAVGTRSRKQREIAERHELILDVARELLLDGGYLGLTMDRVAARTEYSKGTIYQHFKNKEELVLALTVQTGGQRAALFERAATFRGRPRERFAAVGLAAELHFLLHPDHFKCEHIVRTSSIKDKIPPERHHELQLCEHRCVGAAMGIVRDGIASGDLELPGGLGPGDLTWGVWTMSVGAFSIMAAGLGSELGIEEPLRALRQNQNRLLDGYGWRPLASEHDYEATRDRIKQELFAEECRPLGPEAAW